MALPSPSPIPYIKMAKKVIKKKRKVTKSKYLGRRPSKKDKSSKVRKIKKFLSTSKGKKKKKKI